MNVLVLHNSYRQRGGEDVVVEAESDLLKSAGHTVHVETVSNQSITGLSGKAQTFIHAAFDPDKRDWMHSLLALHSPDVVHVHNFFPLLTLAVHEATAAAGVAVVQTLHNYRLLCSSSLLLREGAVCEKCLGGKIGWGLVHRCYRGSFAGSLAVAMMQSRAKRQRWRIAHRFIALTEFAKRKFVEGGLPEDRLVVKPNFKASAPVTGGVRRMGALYVGRLSPEKGVALLIEAMRRVPDVHLTVLGDGPERASLERGASPNVSFRGSVDAGEVERHMSAAQCLVVPSTSYEGFPMTVVEAFAVGLPVLASNLGSLGEIVTDGHNGRHFAPNDAEDLAGKLRELLGAPATLGVLSRGAYADHEALYSPGRNLAKLEAIYAAAISLARVDNAGLDSAFHR